MTPQDALKVLSDATAALNLNRAQHTTVIKALETLQLAITPKEAQQPQSK